MSLHAALGGCMDAPQHCTIYLQYNMRTLEGNGTHLAGSLAIGMSEKADLPGSACMHYSIDGQSDYTWNSRSECALKIKLQCNAVQLT